MPQSRRRRLIYIILGAVVLSLAGTAAYIRWFRHGLPEDVRAALEDSRGWTLFSLNPDIPNLVEHRRSIPPKGDPRRVELEGKKLLHGWPVLGQLPLPDATEILGKVALMDRTYLNHDTWFSSSTGNFCFLPRHALIKTLPDGRKLELLICFQCDNLQWYWDGRRAGDIDFPNMSGTGWNDILKDAGVPLPPQQADQ